MKRFLDDASGLLEWAVMVWLLPLPVIVYDIYSGDTIPMSDSDARKYVLIMIKPMACSLVINIRPHSQ